MDGQLSVFDVIGVDPVAERSLAVVAEGHDGRADVVALFEPNGRRRCPGCRKRLHAFAGRLLCANPYCPGESS